jgi:hypothetical protein
MSWKSGSQLTMTDSSSSWNVCWIIRWLCARLPRLIVTPLGADVEPDVYCRNAIASASRFGCTHAAASRA